MIPAYSQSRQFRLGVAVVGLLWGVLAFLAEHKEVKQWAEEAVKGSEAVDPFFVLSEFYGQVAGHRPAPPKEKEKEKDKDESEFHPDWVELTKPKPVEEPSAWEKFKEWVKPPDQGPPHVDPGVRKIFLEAAGKPPDQEPPHIDPTRRPGGLPSLSPRPQRYPNLNFLTVWDALRYTLWKVMDAGWPAVIPTVLAFGIGIAAFTTVIEKSKHAGWFIHPIVLVPALLLVFGIAGIVALIFRLVLVTVFGVLGSATTLAVYVSPVILGINAILSPATELRDKIQEIRTIAKEGNDSSKQDRPPGSTTES